MKILSWVEVALATPMVLAFTSIAGVQAVAAASIVLAVLMSFLKWGKKLILSKKNTEVASAN